MQECNKNVMQYFEKKFSKNITDKIMPLITEHNCKP